MDQFYAQVYSSLYFVSSSRVLSTFFHVAYSIKFDPLNSADESRAHRGKRNISSVWLLEGDTLVFEAKAYIALSGQNHAWLS